MAKPSAEARVRKEATEQWLVECGWWSGDGGWRSANLNGAKFPWPMMYAARLQLEANGGCGCPCCCMLRGDR